MLPILTPFSSLSIVTRHQGHRTTAKTLISVTPSRESKDSPGSTGSERLKTSEVSPLFSGRVQRTRVDDTSRPHRRSPVTLGNTPWTVRHETLGTPQSTTLHTSRYPSDLAHRPQSKKRRVANKGTSPLIVLECVSPLFWLDGRHPIFNLVYEGQPEVSRTLGPPGRDS